MLIIYWELVAGCDISLHLNNTGECGIIGLSKMQPKSRSWILLQDSGANYCNALLRDKCQDLPFKGKCQIK